jgi:hypothetical protein
MSAEEGERWGFFNRGLRHRLGVDRLVDAHRPFHLEHALGDAVGVGRPGSIPAGS